MLVSNFQQDGMRMARAASQVRSWTSNQPSWLEWETVTFYVSFC